MSRSVLPGFMDLLYGRRPRNGEHPGSASGNSLHRLDKSFPPHAAGPSNWGAALVKTRTAILVAVCNAPIGLAECIPVVEHLADYLISVNY
ncbi:profilin [Streptomyces mutabilis]|uniref:profilin n=1 Tax=Streptomyces mutabilis TaxID=67332 RepID=UPI0008FB9DDF|nr:profilin [Streptomyces mutabilis]